MIDRSYIGQKRKPLTVAVEPFQLRLFAKAIGETNPIYLEEEAAKKGGLPQYAGAADICQCSQSEFARPLRALARHGHRARQGAAR